MFYDGKSIIDVHSQFSGLADMINIFANAPFTLFGGNPYLGTRYDTCYPGLMSAYDFPKALEEGKAIPHWDVFATY